MRSMAAGPFELDESMQDLFRGALRKHDYSVWASSIKAHDQCEAVPRRTDVTAICGATRGFLRLDPNRIVMDGSFMISVPHKRTAPVNAHSQCKNSSKRINNMPYTRQKYTLRGLDGLPAKLPPSIDVHCHAIPPSYRDHLIKQGYTHPDGDPGIPVSPSLLPCHPIVFSTRTHTDQEWTAEAPLEFMQCTNITLSIPSISSPGTNLSTLSVPLHGGVHTLTRAFNTEICDVCKRHLSTSPFSPLYHFPTSMQHFPR